MSQITTLTAADETFNVYVARPKGEPIGGLILIHEIWGLVGHIRDVAERYAALGWLVAAPDILSRGGIEPEVGLGLYAKMTSRDEEVRIGAQPLLRAALAATRAPEYATWAISALRATADWLEAEPGVGDRLVVTGFCFGGTYAFELAASDDRIRAAAPFYGRAPEPERIAKIACPVLAIYGFHDPALVDALPDVRRTMTDAGVDFKDVVYPDAAHAFFNDTGPQYRPVDAADAWERVTAFLHEHV